MLYSSIYLKHRGLFLKGGDNPYFVPQMTDWLRCVPHRHPHPLDPPVRASIKQSD